MDFLGAYKEFFWDFLPKFLKTVETKSNIFSHFHIYEFISNILFKIVVNNLIHNLSMRIVYSLRLLGPCQVKKVNLLLISTIKERLLRR